VFKRARESQKQGKYLNHRITQKKSKAGFRLWALGFGKSKDLNCRKKPIQAKVEA